MGTARNMFPSKDKRDLTKPILREDLIQYDDLNGTGGGSSGVSQIIAGTNVTISSTGPSGTGNVTINASGGGGSGTVTGVTATGPITSTGGTAPVISTEMSTNKLIGRSSGGTGVMEEITIGTGLQLSGGTISNTGLTTTPTIQATITAGRTLSQDILTIGDTSGDSVTAQHAVALGQNALRQTNGGNNVAIGFNAGASSALQTNSYSVMIGDYAGQNVANAKTENIAIGKNAYKTGASSNNVAIGTNAGLGDTGNGFGNSVFIGTDAGYDRLGSTSNSGDAVVAIGNLSLTANSGSSAVGIGSGAGAGNTGDNLVAIGLSAGNQNTGDNVIAIGNGAGSNSVQNKNIFIGLSAGNNNNARNIIALGESAGDSNVIDGQFIISNSSLPFFNDQASAISYYSFLTTLSTGCTYLYYNDQLKTIEGYRT